MLFLKKFHVLVTFFFVSMLALHCFEDRSHSVDKNKKRLMVNVTELKFFHKNTNKIVRLMMSNE